MNRNYLGELSFTAWGFSMTLVAKAAILNQRLVGVSGDNVSYLIVANIYRSNRRQTEDLGQVSKKIILLGGLLAVTGTVYEYEKDQVGRVGPACDLGQNKTRDFSLDFAILVLALPSVPSPL